MPTGGLLLGQCPELPPTRVVRVSDPLQRLVHYRFVWPQPVLFQAADGAAVQTLEVEVLWRMPDAFDGSLASLGVEATGPVAFGGMDFGPEARTLHVSQIDIDGDGRPDAIEVESDGVGGILEEAPTLQGPWTAVPDQFEQGAGRYTIPLPLQNQTNAARFFRVRY